MKARNPWFALWPVWAVPAVLVVANGLWLGGVRGALVGRSSLLARQVRDAEATVARLEREAATLEEARRASGELEERLAALRGGAIGSMKARLVPFLKDVVERGQEAGLANERISYQVRSDEDTGLTYFAATYELEGTYEAIRTYIGLLERSPQFVVIDRLDLRGTDDASALTVKVRLTVGTYFFDLDRELLATLDAGGVGHGR